DYSTVALEYRHEEGRQRESAAGPRRFRRPLDVPTVDACPCSPHRQYPVLKIDIIPAESDELAAPETEGHRGDDKGSEALAFEACDQPCGLRARERLHLGPSHRRRTRQSRDVTVHKLPAHRVRDCGAQHPSNMGHMPPGM